MNIRKWVTLISLAFGLLLMSGVSQAALLQFEDDDIDWHLDRQLNQKSGTFEVGDVLVAVFEIPVFTVDGNNAIPDGMELTGVSAIQIDSITPIPVVGGSVITFRPYEGGLNSVLALGGHGGVTDGGAGEGAMLAMWFNSDVGAADLDVNFATSGLAGGTASCTSLFNCITEASMGELFQVDGFDGDPDNLWRSTTEPGGDSSTVVATIDPATGVASFNARLSNFFHDGPEVTYRDISGNNCGTGLGPVADGCWQVTVSGSIKGGNGLDNGAFAHSDFDASKNTIPEPSILGLLGIGLMGIFLARRRQRA